MSDAAEVTIAVVVGVLAAALWAFDLVMFVRVAS